VTGKVSGEPIDFGTDTSGSSLNGQVSSASLDRLLLCLDGMGITRLSDITALDRIGIPVAQAVRPLGFSNATTQGKGMDLASAAVSAIMEAAEQFFSERIERFLAVKGTAEKLGVPTERFKRQAFPEVSHNWHLLETAWVEAEDMITGRSTLLPLELTHTAYTEPGLPTDGLFQASTTGLACSFEEENALVHGMLECIERGAIAEAHQTHGFFQRFRIGQIEDTDDELQFLLDLVRSAGMLCAFWNAPAAGGIPVIWCQIMENGGQPPITPYPSDGFAADLDPIRAAKRALQEAAQSRLAAISGSRDDLTRSSFPAHTDWNLIEAHRRLLADAPAAIPAASLIDQIAAGSGDTIGYLMRRLEEDGVTSILKFQYDTLPFPEIVAMRIALPELMPLNED
jgi:YcaO-like protein with predicted kinase domain